jgi:photosystem II stability/assembly factor-like uncharacterized protein
MIYLTSVRILRSVLFISFFYSAFFSAQAQLIENVTDLQLNEIRFYDATFGLGVAAKGRIIKTTNGGDYWKLIDPKLPLKSDLQTVFFQPNGTSYVGGNDGVLLRSTDQGESWSSIELPYKFPVTSIHFSGDTLGIITMEKFLDSYLLRTKDGGATWTLLQHHYSSYHDIEFTSTNTGFFIYSDQLLRTDDRGMTWTVVKEAPGFPDPFLDVDFVTSQVGYLATKYTLYKTIDGGVTWNGISSINIMGGSQIQFIDEQTGYCSSYGKLLKTTDGGLNWTEIVARQYVNDSKLPSYFINASKGFYENVETGQLFKTTDGGETWKLVLDEPGNNYLQTSETWRANVFVKSDKDVFSVDSDTLLWRTDNAGVFWHPQTVGTEDLNSVYFIDDLKGFLVGENGSYYETGDGGASWEKRDIGVTKHLYKISFRDNVHGAITGRDGTFLKTSDAGATWTNVSLTLPAGIHVYSGELIDQNTLFALAYPPIGQGWMSAQGLYTSSDGSTWTKRELPSISIAYDGHMIDASNFSITGDYGWLLESSNSGQSFTYATPANTGMLMSSMHFPKNGDVGYATGAYGKLLRTNDKGKNWTLVSEYEDYYVSGWSNVRMLNDTTGFVTTSEAVGKVTCDLSGSYLLGDFNHLCEGVAYSYSVFRNTYSTSVEWKVVGGTIQDQQNGQVTVLWSNSGTRYLEATLSTTNCNTKRTIRQDITTNGLPSATTVINGELVVCTGDYAYEVKNPQLYVFYKWEISGGGNFRIDNEQHKTVLRWLTPGTYTLKLTSWNMVCDKEKVENFTVNVVAIPPAKVSSITGSKSVCDLAATYEYTVPASTTIKYKWTIVGGEILEQTNEKVKVKWQSQAPLRLSVQPKLACLTTDTTMLYVNLLLPQDWYEDKDGDTFGNSLVKVNTCTKPAGYVGNSTDCNDNNVAINPNAKWYRDLDGDTYGNEASFTLSCVQPSGYVSRAQDCNDANPGLHPETKWYRDQDGDTYGNILVFTLSCSQPSGYVSSAKDCNDANAALNPLTKWYEDKDGDSFGNPAVTSTSCTQPAGYVSNNQDCNDTQSTLNPNTTWYKDADGDGYGDATSTLKQCSQPSGYVSNSDDCNDTNANLTPENSCITALGELRTAALTIYPNPCSSLCKISSSEIQIFDLCGRPVTNFTIEDGYLDVTNMTDGLYFVRGAGGMMRLVVRK